VAEALGNLGRRVEFVYLDEIQPRPGARALLEARGLPAFPISQLGERVSPGATLVVGNDWGPPGLKEPLERARLIADVKVVAIVEGSRFGRRNQYRRADEVLAWGPSARRLIGRDVVVVGSPVIEAAAWDESRFEQPPFVAVNYKFPYAYDGIEFKDSWLAQARAGCERAGIAYALSRHPADTDPPHGVEFSDMDDLLRRASVVLSRSSTVVYEALARGKPVVLFPHPEENLAEFAAPLGAYEIARSADELPAALRRALERIPEQRQRARRFLERHVRIGERGEVTRRIIEHLAAR
jgi:hypothetical protein